MRAPQPGPASALAAGSVSGLMNGSAGMGGPPAVLLYFSSATPTADGRATLIAYFLATDAIGFALMAAHGLVDSMVLSHTLWFAPVAIGGIAVGQHVFGRTGGTGFKTTVLSVLIVLSLAMLGRALFVG